jgi:TrpR-related protein YerC/YecD
MSEIKNNHQNLEELYELFTCFESSQEVKLFLEDLCTPVDLAAMAARWRVVKELKKEKPYRQIQAETGVSLTTISRVARCLSYGSDGYNIIYDKLKKDAK